MKAVIVIDINERAYEEISKSDVRGICVDIGYDYNEFGYIFHRPKRVLSIKPLPKGHGAIKDVSQIEIPMCEDRAYEKWVQVAINSAPTIIEADTGETDDAIPYSKLKEWQEHYGNKCTYGHIMKLIDEWRDANE